MTIVTDRDLSESWTQLALIPLSIPLMTHFRFSLTEPAQWAFRSKRAGFCSLRLQGLQVPLLFRYLWQVIAFSTRRQTPPDLPHWWYPRPETKGSSCAMKGKLNIETFEDKEKEVCWKIEQNIVSNLEKVFSILCSGTTAGRIWNPSATVPGQQRFPEVDACLSKTSKY